MALVLVTTLQILQPPHDSGIKYATRAESCRDCKSGATAPPSQMPPAISKLNLPLSFGVRAVLRRFRCEWSFSSPQEFSERDQ
jgi:hypothetical protein